jgi:hypothetical protein
LDDEEEEAEWALPPATEEGEDPSSEEPEAVRPGGLSSLKAVLLDVELV